MNEQILLYLNNLVVTNETLEKVVFVFSDIPIFFIPVFLVIMWIYYSIKKYNIKKENLLFILYSCIVGMIISITLQKIIHTDRPELYLKSIGKILLKHLPNESFPSDHATLSSSFLISLFFYSYKKVGFIFLPFVIVMLLSRIGAGVHWPRDIIAGIIVGIISSFITYKYIKNLELIIKINKFILKLTSYIKL